MEWFVFSLFTINVVVFEWMFSRFALKKDLDAHFLDGVGFVLC